MRPKIKTPDTPFVPSDALIASWGGRRIIFIGYMGAGKTTIGRQLAEREPFYNKAKYTFDVSLLDNYEKIESTVADLRKMLGIDP